MLYFNSSEEGNVPLECNSVFIVISEGEAPNYFIEFLLHDGTKKEWQYSSKTKRDNDIVTVSRRLLKCIDDI